MTRLDGMPFFDFPVKLDAVNSVIDRDELGPQWEARRGMISVDAEEGMRMTAFNGYAEAGFKLSPLGDGVAQLVWNPIELATEWKSLHVYMHPESSAEKHRISFRVDMETCALTERRAQASAGISSGPQFGTCSTSTMSMVLSSSASTASSWGSTTFPAGEKTTAITILAADNGTSQLVRSFAYVAS